MVKCEQGITPRDGRRVGKICRWSLPNVLRTEEFQAQLVVAPYWANTFLGLSISLPRFTLILQGVSMPARDIDFGKSANDTTQNDAIKQTIRSFIEETPIGGVVTIPRFVLVSRRSPAPMGIPPTIYHCLDLPSVTLECPNVSCEGSTWFDHKGELSDTFVPFLYFYYRCRHCQEEEIFIAVKCNKLKNAIELKKIGSEPRFRLRIPSRILRGMSNQSDVDFLRKAAELESLGFGIGSFVYYRRVIESQRDALFDMLIKVLEREAAPAETIAEVQRAKGIYQFTQSFEAVAPLVPQSLFIGQENPFLLLHGALSKGVHQLVDAECLERSKAVRIVLIALSERLQQLTANQEELRSAIATLKRKPQFRDDEPASSKAPHAGSPDTTPNPQ